MDIRCPFFQRQRGELAWDVSEQQLMDTISGTRGALPHYNQVVWSFNKNTTKQQNSIVDIDGLSYYIGHGNPGRAAEGESNNCLIDSLRQCVGLLVDRRKVRADLQKEFCNAEGRALVTQTSYLDIEYHWRAILQSLFRYNTSGLPPHCEIHEWCVIALDYSNPGNGNVNGNLAAPNRLVVMNTMDRHFDPCLWFQTRAASSGAQSSSG
jgi:hypothetical protein